MQTRTRSQSLSALSNRFLTIKMIVCAKMLYKPLGQVAAYANKDSIPIIISLLQQALSHEDYNVRIYATRALEQVAAQADKDLISIIISSLQQALSDKNGRVRACAAEAL